MTENNFANPGVSGSFNPQTARALAEEMTREELIEGLLRVTETAAREQKSGSPRFQYQPDDATVAMMDRNQVPTVDFSEELSHRNPGQLSHRLLIGDNLDALMGLALAEEDTYDAVVTDPPYNTGNNDFTYNDNFVSTEDAWRHTKWLSFMEPRMRLIHRLLSRTGILAISIGPEEVHRLRALLDSIFGERNFIELGTWQGSGSSLSRATSGGADYMLFYAKSIDAHFEKVGRWQVPKRNLNSVLKAAARIWKNAGGDRELAREEMGQWYRENAVNLDPGTLLYDRFDERGRLYRTGDLSANNNAFFEVLHPNGLPVKAPRTGWRTTPGTMQLWITEGKIEFGEDETTVPTFRRFLEENPTQLPSPLILANRANGRARVESIVGKDAFSFPKNHDVLAAWIAAFTPTDAKILDPFAGSGSTGDAVLSLNNDSGSTRRFTLVTNDEQNIGTNVTRERLVRVMTGADWAVPTKAKALGGQLAVYRVASRPLGEAWDTNSYSADEQAWSSWNRDAFTWCTCGEAPWPAQANPSPLVAIVHGDDPEDNGGYLVGTLDAEVERRYADYVATDLSGDAETAVSREKLPHFEGLLPRLPLAKLDTLRRDLYSLHYVDYAAVAGLSFAPTQEA